MITRLFVGLTFTTLALQACARDQPADSVAAVSNPFVGAWRIVHTSVTDESGTAVNESPEAGLYVFTERHFTNMLIPSSAREPFSAEPTDSDRLAAYDNFIADGGTYDYTQTTLTSTNLIAKVPNVMPPHRVGGPIYEWRFDGDELVLTLRNAWAPRDGEITYRLERLE